VTDKSEEQISRERAAVEAMKGAKSNMATVLERIVSLERALDNARDALSRIKPFIAPGTYQYASGSTGNNIKCADAVDNAVAAITKELGR
jgi:hypothetical protein